MPGQNRWNKTPPKTASDHFLIIFSESGQRDCRPCTSKVYGPMPNLKPNNIMVGVDGLVKIIDFRPELCHRTTRRKEYRGNTRLHRPRNRFRRSTPRPTNRCPSILAPQCIGVLTGDKRYPTELPATLRGQCRSSPIQDKTQDPKGDQRQVFHWH